LRSEAKRREEKREVDVVAFYGAGGQQTGEKRFKYNMMIPLL
jgi:hypothetical protein